VETHAFHNVEQRKEQDLRAKEAAKKLSENQGLPMLALVAKKGPNQRPKMGVQLKEVVQSSFMTIFCIHLA
jgi:hypothetical protein